MASRKPSRPPRPAKRSARKTAKPARPAARRTPKAPARRPAKAPARAAKPARPMLSPRSVLDRQIDKRRNDPQTLRLRAFEPSFTVNDIQKSIAFYTKILGFIEGERHTGKDGALKGAMVKAGACTIGLSQDDWSKGRDRVKGVGTRLWCETVQDINALADRIRNAGGVLTDGPTDNKEWKMQMLGIDDPDGYHISIFRSTEG
jgi:uncharacterized glyoxalase superfamily protein PhnB